MFSTYVFFSAVNLLIVLLMSAAFLTNVWTLGSTSFPSSLASKMISIALCLEPVPMALAIAVLSFPMTSILAFAVSHPYRAAWSMSVLKIELPFFIHLGPS